VSYNDLNLEFSLKSTKETGLESKKENNYYLNVQQVVHKSPVTLVEKGDKS